MPKYRSSFGWIICYQSTRFVPTLTLPQREAGSTRRPCPAPTNPNGGWRAPAGPERFDERRRAQTRYRAARRSNGVGMGPTGTSMRVGPSWEIAARNEDSSSSGVVALNPLAP